MTQTTEQTRKCSNCMWWVTEMERAPSANCTALPPMPVYSDRLVFVVPRVDADHACSLFRMKEPQRVISVDGHLTLDGLRTLRKIYGVEDPDQ